MKKYLNKRTIGFALGLIVCAGVWLMPIDGLPIDGRKCLALSLAAVVWWATGAMHPGFTSLALLLGYILLLDPAVVPTSVVLGIWTTPTIYLVIGGFLIAAAVQGSGLGQRVALTYIKRFVGSYASIILSCYLLPIVLSFMIPHPWPRSFLLISIMAYVTRAAGLDEQYVPLVGLAVFAGSIPTAMFLLTGDSTLNPAIAGFAGEELSWIKWLLYMGVPALCATALTLGNQLISFPRPKSFTLNKDDISAQLHALGPMKSLEKKVLAIIALSVVLWMTDALHGLAAGWVAVIGVVLLASPLVGALDAKSWGQVNVGTLLFLCAALAIGTVGGKTGMNEWVAHLLMPANVPSNPYIFALIATGISMAMHMVLGSTLAVLGIAAPAIVAFGASVGVPALPAALIAYTAVALHWMLPFHHMNLLVGLDEGGYTDRQTLRMGAVQTVVVVLTVMVEVTWWKLIGVM